MCLFMVCQRDDVTEQTGVMHRAVVSHFPVVSVCVPNLRGDG